MSDQRHLLQTPTPDNTYIPHNSRNIRTRTAYITHIIHTTYVAHKTHTIRATHTTHTTTASYTTRKAR